MHATRAGYWREEIWKLRRAVIDADPVLSFRAKAMKQAARQSKVTPPPADAVAVEATIGPAPPRWMRETAGEAMPAWPD